MPWFRDHSDFGLSLPFPCSAGLSSFFEPGPILTIRVRHSRISFGQPFSFLCISGRTIANIHFGQYMSTSYEGGNNCHYLLVRSCPSLEGQNDLQSFLAHPSSSLSGQYISLFGPFPPFPMRTRLSAFSFLCRSCPFL